MRAAAVILTTLSLCTLGCGASKPAVETQTMVNLDNGSFSVTENDRILHYEVHGNGPVLMVLTNSWGLSLEGLRGLFAPLESRLTMVYFDPRGLGLSSPVTESADMGLAAVRDDFHTVRRHLGLDTVNAIGWSNGATNLILLAFERPETIETAIFVHGAADYGREDMMAFARDYPELAQQYVAFQQEMADEALTDDERTVRMKDLWIDVYFPTMTADPETARPAIRSAFADAQFSWSHSQYATQESPGFDHRDRLGEITARSLVIAGAHDSMPTNKVQVISDGIVDSSFEVFEASGHFAPLEERDRFAASVFEFLGVQVADENR